MANELVGRASDRCRWRSDPLRAATGGSGMALERRRHIKWKRSALTEAEMMNIANAQNSKRTQKEILELEEQNRARL